MGFLRSTVMGKDYPTQDKSLGGFFGNLLGDVGELAKGLGTLAVTGVKDLAGETGQLFTGEDYSSSIDDVVKAMPGAIMGDYKNRYGSGLDQFGEALYEDPLSFVFDALDLAGIGAAAKGLRSGASHVDEAAEAGLIAKEAGMRAEDVMEADAALMKRAVDPNDIVADGQVGPMWDEFSQPTDLDNPPGSDRWTEREYREFYSDRTTPGVMDAKDNQALKDAGLMYRGSEEGDQALVAGLADEDLEKLVQSAEFPYDSGLGTIARDELRRRRGGPQMTPEGPIIPSDQATQAWAELNPDEAREIMRSFDSDAEAITDRVPDDPQGFSEAVEGLTEDQKFQEWLSQQPKDEFLEELKRQAESQPSRFDDVNTEELIAMREELARELDNAMAAGREDIADEIGGELDAVDIEIDYRENAGVDAQAQYYDEEYDQNLQEHQAQQEVLSPLETPDLNQMAALASMDDFDLQKLWHEFEDGTELLDGPGIQAFMRVEDELIRRGWMEDGSGISRQIWLDYQQNRFPLGSGPSFEAAPWLRPDDPQMLVPYQPGLDALAQVGGDSPAVQFYGPAADSGTPSLDDFRQWMDVIRRIPGWPQ